MTRLQQIGRLILPMGIYGSLIALLYLLLSHYVGYFAALLNMLTVCLLGLALTLGPLWRLSRLATKEIAVGLTEPSVRDWHPSPKFMHTFQDLPLKEQVEVFAKSAPAGRQRERVRSFAQEVLPGSREALEDRVRQVVQFAGARE